MDSWISKNRIHLSPCHVLPEKLSLAVFRMIEAGAHCHSGVIDIQANARLYEADHVGFWLVVVFLSSKLLSHFFKPLHNAQFLGFYPKFFKGCYPSRLRQYMTVRELFKRIALFVFRDQPSFQP